MPQLHSDPLSRFEWAVAPGGYRWIESKWGVVLTPCDEEPGEPRRYRPFTKRHAGLFRTFAELEPTQDAVLSFANEFGMLGAPWSQPRDESRVILTAEDQAFADRQGINVGERYEPIECFDRSPDGDNNHCWTMQIALMSSLIRLADRDLPTRGRYFDPAFPTGSLNESEVVARLRFDGTGVTLKKQVNKALNETCGFELAWFPDREKPFSLNLTPHSLLGTLWLQMAYSLAGYKTWRECGRTGCDRFIEISREPTTGARSDARFCSDACRARHYRARKRQAIELAAKGWSAARIGRELRSDTQTVRGWLKLMK